MDVNIDFLKRRPLSLASNSSGGSQLVVCRKSEKKRLGGSFSGSSEGCVSDDASIRQSIIRFSSEPYISNVFESSQIKSSSLCNFYQYYYDQFLTAKSKKSSTYCLLDEKFENHESAFQSSIRNIINELLETENAYVNDLLDVINGYLVPMEKDSHMTSRECSLIFANITSLFSFNQSLLKELRESGNNVDLVAATFIRNQDNFLLYSSYCSNYPRCLEAIERCISKGATRHLLTTLQASLTHQLPLAAYLLKPIQRISKYHLFFQNIINCYSPPLPPTRQLPPQPPSSSSPRPPPQPPLSSSPRPPPQPPSSSSPRPPPRHQPSSSSSLQQLIPRPLHQQQSSSSSLKQQSSSSALHQPSSSSRLSLKQQASSSLHQPSSSSSSSSSSLHQPSSSPSSSSSRAPASSSRASTGSSAEQASTAREALRCMNKVMEHINQTNTLRKQLNNTHARTHASKKKKKAFERPAEIGDLLFKEKFYEGSGKKGVYHLFVFSRAVMVTRKKNKNKHLVKVFFETKDVVLVEDVPYHPSWFYLVSKLNNKQHIKLEARSVEQKVQCCHQLKRVVSSQLTNYFLHHVLVSCLTDSFIESEDKKEKIIDKSSFITIEGTSNAPHHKRIFNRTHPNLESTPKFYNSTSHNLAQLKPISMVVSSRKKPFIDVRGTPDPLESSKDNYLFTLKLPRAKRSSAKSFFSGYKEVKCTDICMEGCEGVYKRYAPQESPSILCQHYSHQDQKASGDVDTALLNTNDNGVDTALHNTNDNGVDAAVNNTNETIHNDDDEDDDELPSDSSACQSVDFYYEDKLLGDLDNLSVMYGDSDFEDSILSDDSSLNSSLNFTNHDTSIAQCIESAF